MISVALVEPEIPQNTGNIARLCAATRTPLHLVGALGFRIDDRAVRRAGLDYWEHVDLTRHRDLDALRQALPQGRFLYFSTKVEMSYLDWTFNADDCLVFGRETGGLAGEVFVEKYGPCLTHSMLNFHFRKLELDYFDGDVL